MIIAGVTIRVSQHVHNAPDRIVTLHGPLNAIGQAIHFIVRKLSERDFERDDRRAGTTTFRMLVPAFRMGLLIGKGGSKIKELQTASGARIYSQDQNLPNSTERILTIVGDAESMQIACYTIASQIGNDHENPTFPSQILFDPGFRNDNPYPYYPGGSGGGGSGYWGDRGQSVGPPGPPGRGISRAPYDQYPSRDSAPMPSYGDARYPSVSASAPATGGSYPPSGAVVASGTSSGQATPTAEQQAAMTAYYQAYYPQMMAQMAQYSQQNPQLMAQYQQYYASCAQMGGGAGYAAPPPSGPKVTAKISIPNPLVGGIIGRGGTNIRDIMAITGTEVLRHS